MAQFLSILINLLLISRSKAIVICTSGDCNINCNLENCDTVICTKQASSCAITCKTDKCRASKFYLAASNHNAVDCDGNDSCQQIDIQCGLPNITPNGYTISDFIGHINECHFILSNNAIPSTGNIQCIGDIDLCQLYALTDNDDFKHSQFQCQLTPQNAECIMQCNTDKSCGSNTSTFDCIAPQCQCDGTGCNQIKTSFATADPTKSPTISPTRSPTNIPTITPTQLPSNNPSIAPTITPTVNTKAPSLYPTIRTTVDSTVDPTAYPTIYPTADPTTNPTTDPTKDPTAYPTIDPTKAPTDAPTTDPTVNPSSDPTSAPTINPSNAPTIYPTIDPTSNPTIFPTELPTTKIPSIPPTIHPTEAETTETQKTLRISSDESNNNEIYMVISILLGILYLMCSVCCCIRIYYDYQHKILDLKDEVICSDNIANQCKLSNVTSSDLPSSFGIDETTNPIQLESQISDDSNWNDDECDHDKTPKQIAIPPHITVNSLQSIALLPSIPSIATNNMAYPSDICPPRNSSPIPPKDNDERNKYNRDRMIKCDTDFPQFIMVQNASHCTNI